MLNMTPLKNLLPANVFAQLHETVIDYGLNSPERAAHFLGQCAHESRNFSAVEENLNYSAPRLAVVFGKRIHNAPNPPEYYAHNPERLANLVYANRMGNGDTTSGDGYRYRGRGYIQLTGKANYSLFDQDTTDNILANPDLVASKYPLKASAFFWQNNGLNHVADKGVSLDITAAVSIRVNGSRDTVQDRYHWVMRYFDCLK